MRDFPVIDSAESQEKLRLRLKQAELEQYGDPLTPEYVYDVIKRLPRFDNMKVRRASLILHLYILIQCSVANKKMLRSF